MLKYIDRLYIKGGSSAVGRRLNKILGSIIAPIFYYVGYNRRVVLHKRECYGYFA